MSTLVIQLPEHRRLRAGRAATRRADPGAAARVRLRHQRRRHRVRSARAGRRRRCCRRASQRDRRRSAKPTSAGTASPCRRRRRRGCAPRSSACSRRRCSTTPRSVHLAVAPLAVAGQPTWVAAVDRAWLAGRARGAAEGRRLRRPRRADGLARRAADGPLPRRRRQAASAPATDVVLTWAQRRRRRHRAPATAAWRAPWFRSRRRSTTRWTAAPTARASPPSRWLGAPVDGDAGRAAPAAGRPQPLEPAPVRPGPAHPRRPRAARLAAPGDEPGLAAGAHRRRGAGRWRRSSASTSGPGTRRAKSRPGATRSRRWSKQTYPRVADADIQRDAGAVMLRETQALRTLAGKPGDSDLEPMLQAAAAAWPSERPPVENLRFEPGKLTLAASGWSDRPDRAVPQRPAAGRLPGQRQRRPDRRDPRPRRRLEPQHEPPTRPACRRR